MAARNELCILYIGWVHSLDSTEGKDMQDSPWLEAMVRKQHYFIITRFPDQAQSRGRGGGLNLSSCPVSLLFVHSGSTAADDCSSESVSASPAQKALNLLVKHTDGHINLSG